MTQFFKGDASEQKFYNAGLPTLQAFVDDKADFFDEAYAGFVLGELLYDNSRAPLANAIAREIFRESFPAIFEAFTVAGSFESYLTVFRSIFGADSVILFTVAAPGKLQIAITATNIVYSNFVAREIDGGFVYSEMIDDHATPDEIVFKSIKGFESEYEVEQMLFELVPAGIYTEITLTLGG